MRQAKRQIKNPLTMFTALAAPLLLAASCAVGPDPDEDSGTVGSIGQGACEFAACAKGTGCPPDDECADWACDMNAVCCVYTKLLGIGDPCKDLEGKAGTCVTTPAGYPACCAGCIDRSGNCQPGTDVAACGPPGSECVSCDSVECHTTSCNGEKCLYEPQNGTMCSGGTCDDGSCCQTCFEGGTCYDLNDDQHCGPSCDACGPCERCVAGACQPKADGDSCDDGDACTEPDACSGGTCQGTTVTCNDNNECTTDSCDPASGCDYAPKAGSCNDGSACTADDSCVAGECVGVAVVCDDGNFCTADGCDDEMGCVYTSKAQDTPCDDGNACSPTSACRDMDSMGNSLEPRQCVATSGLDCNDNDPCTSDACEENGPGPDDDTCQNPRQAINEGGGCSSTLCMTGQTCAAGACQGGMALDCDDANTCTADGCEPAEGCTHAPADETCNDGNPCTLDDACDNGACAGVEVECAPLDSCHQAGSCDASTGTCSDPRKPDGSTCGNSGRCQTGSCIDAVNEGGAGGEPGGPVASGGDDSPGAGTSGSGASAPPDGGVFVRDPGGCACAVPGEPRGSRGLRTLALVFAAFAGLLRRRRGRSAAITGS